ncbi:hypothetical protein GCM10010392_41870 [Streptomyces clavifer]|nr:hypothetical protein GCM10010392_41870 [Streptomyces clavifer]
MTEIRDPEPVLGSPGTSRTSTLPLLTIWNSAHVPPTQQTAPSPPGSPLPNCPLQVSERRGDLAGGKALRPRATPERHLGRRQRLGALRTDSLQGTLGEVDPIQKM